MREFHALCDVLITTEEDVEKVFGHQGANNEAVARKLTEEFPVKTWQLRCRQSTRVAQQLTAIAYTSGQVLKTRSYEVEIVDRLGAATPLRRD